jgi:hypothetical protein
MSTLLAVSPRPVIVIVLCRAVPVAVETIVAVPSRVTPVTCIGRNAVYVPEDVTQEVVPAILALIVYTCSVSLGIGAKAGHRK